MGTHTRRRGASAVMFASVVALVAACGTPPSSGPPLLPLPPPTPDAVVQVTTRGASTSYHPMSADGRFVAYSQADLTAPVRDAYLWDASTGSTVALTTTVADGATTGATAPPFVSNDGSTVVFTSTAATVAGQPNSGRSVFVYSTDTSTTEQLVIPEPFGAGPIDDVSSSRDGSLIVVSFGDKVLTWTAVSGFSELTDPARIDAGTVLAFSSLGAPVSDNGRYVTVMTHIDQSSGDELRACERPEVHDLTSGTVSIGACIEGNSYPWGGGRFYGTPTLAVTDQGTAVFSQPSIGVRSWGPNDSVRQLTGNNVVAWTASPDGNAAGISAVIPSLGAGIGTGFLEIYEPRGRVTLGEQQYRSKAVGIGTDAATVLLESKEPGLVGAGPDDPRALYLWTRAG